MHDLASFELSDVRFYVFINRDERFYLQINDLSRVVIVQMRHPGDFLDSVVAGQPLRYLWMYVIVVNFAGIVIRFYFILF